MRVKFLGVKHTKAPTSGCKVCQAKKVSSGALESAKRITMPHSGSTELFRMYRPTDVSRKDGEYLLSLTYHYKGEQLPMFEKVSPCR